MSREISNYRVSRMPDGSVFLALTFVGGGEWTVRPVGPDDAHFLVDLLRHERPVYVDAKGVIYTGHEPVGEQDTTPDGLPRMA